MLTKELFMEKEEARARELQELIDTHTCRLTSDFVCECSDWILELHGSDAFWDNPEWEKLQKVAKYGIVDF